MSFSRRSFLRTTAISAVSAPFLVVRELTKPASQNLPHAKAGQLMRSTDWNDLIDRVNQLSQQ